MKRKELYRRCLAAVLGTAVAAGAFASPVRAAGLQAAPAAETAPGTPLMLTELVPDTDNENGADAYEYFEITNVSDRAVSLDQYDGSMGAGPGWDRHRARAVPSALDH